MVLDGKKILLLCTTDNMIWQFLTPHIDRLVERGAVVECACSRTGFWFDDLTARGYVMHEIKLTRSPFSLANLRARKQLKKLIVEHGYDVLYCHQAVGGLMGRLLGKKLKKTVVYVVHGFFYWKGCPLKNRLLYRTAEKLLAGRTDAMIVMNSEDYAEARRLKAKKVFNSHGVGLNKAISGKNGIRDELGIGADEKVILTVSEFIPRKNYPVMVAAVAQVTNARYIICGCGKDEAEIRAQVHALGIDDRVIFAGYRKDICDIMNESDVLLHFAKQEGLPVSIIEAMSCGLPVVASDIRGTNDLIKQDGGTLLPIDSNPKAIAEAIVRVLGDAELRRGMGEVNREIAKQYYIEKVLEEYDRIFDEI